MSIGKFRLRPFSHLTLEQIYVADMNGDTLVYAGNLSAGFNLLPLLKSHLVIHDVELSQFDIHIKKDSVEAPFNFQFFIDAFASGDTTTTSSESNFTFEIGDIRLLQGKLSYDILDQVKQDSVFDVNHIHLRDVTVLASLPSIDLKKLNVTLRQLSFHEQSGFKLDSLFIQLKSEGEKIHLNTFHLEMPHSTVNIADATLDYTGSELSDLAKSAAYSLQLDIPRFNLADIKAFSPSLGSFSDDITLKTSINGKLPAIHVDSLNVSYGSKIYLDLNALISNYLNWDTAHVELHSKISAKASGIGEITSFSGITTLPVQTKNVELKAAITGSLPDMKLDITALSSPSGELDIKGTGGYLVKDGQIKFDLNISSTDFDLKTLLNDNPELGLVTMSLSANGSIDSTQNIDAGMNLNVGHFDFHGHAYQDIIASGSYSGQQVNFMLTSNDPFAPLLIKAKANLSDQPSANLYLKTPRLMPGKLNLVPDAEGDILHAVIKADVEGFDPEKMTAMLRLDSVRYQTGKGNADLSYLELNYKASSDSKKAFHLDSKLIDIDMDGNFSLNTIAPSIQGTLSKYFPELIPFEKPIEKTNDQLGINITIYNTEKWSNLLKLPFSVNDSLIITARYSASDNEISLKTDLPKINVNDIILRNNSLSILTDTATNTLHLLVGTNAYTVTDTVQVKLFAETLADSIKLDLGVDLKTPGIDLQTQIGLFAKFGQKQPDISIQLQPSMLRVNQQDVDIKPASFSVKTDEYEIENFEILFSEAEYLKVNGRVSKDESDSIRIALAGIQIETLLKAVQSDLNLKGEINGNIVANQLLTSPIILIDSFSIKGIELQNQTIGDLGIKSAWNEQNQAVMVKAQFSRDDIAPSVLEGLIFPKEDSLHLKTNIRDLRLAWISPFTVGMLDHLNGTLGINLEAKGKITSPSLNGAISLNDANIGVSMTNVQYKISDSIIILPDRISFDDFRITDDQNKQLVINGNVTHTNFSNIRPDLSLKLEDFMILNNPKQVDSLFYGTLRLSGSINTEGSDQDLLVKTTLKNSPDSKVYITIPESEASEAELYKSVIFINKDTLYNSPYFSNRAGIPQESAPQLPIRLQATIELTPDMLLGVVIDPKTKSQATIKGEGQVDFSYNMSNSDMNLFGDYKISEGEFSISVKNLVRRTFTIQPGGTVVFKGDPMATEFDVTAVYKLRADLRTLDQSFINEGLNSTRVNTECHITVSGNMDEMKISYEIKLPNVDESIQRKVNALMTTDEVVFQEIAYLLAVGSFFPPESTSGTSASGTSIVTSMLSSTLSNQLNKALEGVLSDNWSIGTELHADENDASKVEVDVNISTSLFDDRLILSTNIGYNNTSTTTSSGFSGDFEAMYKLTRSGNLLLRMYNTTSAKFSEQPGNTQGIGVIFRREAKRFISLFKRNKNKK
ncbi:MAG: translocation/assembly module TamB domain-containing protein [Bacteroidales bacterium]|nr:translocation/assembly module TamB domain-containing protein [Bacteroidales bacterium]